MKRSLVILLLSAIGLTCAPSVVRATDPPHTGHDVYNYITCSACHSSPAAGLPPWLTQARTEDKTLYTQSCAGCHNQENDSIGSFRSRDIQTHSSFQTSSTHGTWVVGCIICHDPHNQRQALTYPADPNSNIVTGTISSLNSTPTSTISSLTDLTANLTGDYSRYLLIPDTATPWLEYRIRENSATTISVNGAINLYYVKVGETYAIRYGKMIRATLGSEYEAMTFPVPSPMSQVKFFNNSGPNSFADNDTVIDGICQVCHTRTKSFRADGVLEGPGHPVGTAGGNCMTCHPHSRGFKAVGHE